MKIPFGKPIIDHSEKKLVNRVLNSNVLTHGKYSTLFEKNFKKYTGINNCTATSSCTAALHIAYLLIGIKKNDEVIVPCQTHVATAHSIEIAGGKPIFVDSDDNLTGNIDINKIEKKISKKTKAICVVHFLGRPVDMAKVLLLAKKYKLFVVEDCALALGAKYKNKHVGTFGDFSAFSFYPAKHITTADGGMLGVKNNKIYNKAKLIKAFGVDKKFQERKVPGEYDVKYLGINYRLDEIRSAIGLMQLKKLPLILKQRRKNFHSLHDYLKQINGIKIVKTESSPGFISSYYCLSLILEKNLKNKRKHIILSLNKMGIGTSIYYPRIIPEFTYYKNRYKLKTDEFKNGKLISNNSICLPVAPHINKKNIIYISNSLKKIIKDNLR